MEYVAIKNFTDLKDNNRRYTVGDRYPYRGFASKERALELSTRNNLRGKPVIAEKDAKPKEEVVAEKKDEEKFYTKTDINGMKVADLRELATKQGIENADDISGSELKAILIEKMGL